MITVRVLFADSNYNYLTGFNGTLADAQKYFVGQPLNMGNVEDDIQYPIGVEIVK